MYAWVGKADQHHETRQSRRSMQMTTYETNLELAAKSIRENNGVAPKSIRRCRVQGKPLWPFRCDTGGPIGAKGQIGYEIAGRYYTTVADILAADAEAERFHANALDQSDIDALADDHAESMYEDCGEAAYGRED